MYIITLLLGAILFLPNYAIALEECLQSEKIFEPLKVAKNLNKSTKASKPLAFFGAALCGAAVVLFITSGALPPLSYQDQIKIASVPLLLWAALISGHLRAQELSTDNPPVNFNLKILFRSTGVAWRNAFTCSLKELSYIIALAFSILFFSKAKSWLGL
ncbi:hypothetical protein [Pseudomonas pohangensis]|uniref:hypothetical protein n=1 Tax=Pseudomonas pohangensis TaxID=364197 RepID=UPI0012FE5DF9|nr:hypothetical protein [Pseudomonas pohangensis]